MERPAESHTGEHETPIVSQKEIEEVMRAARGHLTQALLLPQFQSLHVMPE